jgi:hypothetical protein
MVGATIDGRRDYRRKPVAHREAGGGTGEVGHGLPVTSGGVVLRALVQKLAAPAAGA